MKILYTAEAVATGDGRDGHARSSDGALDVGLASPPELGGTGEGTNPEQLFAAGYAACFHSALRLVARRRHVDAGGSWVRAKVDFGPSGGGAYGIGVRMDICLPELDREAARPLVDDAHQVCPYSNATRGNISVQLSIVDSEVPATMDSEPAGVPA
ncbi:organic hydroperoxide resistance protein [Paenarthrobacter sp. Z7-10]|uniref:organic hydroperoxide resistance protein n=1 Tax=Paenarthrobacter sp. Z7-10 TaxID=2787635 RepID=UPI0022A92539|nr:organic hydroperoxide resistance protein [Paenarthrobacter sp. Z7-10]MCZ2403060.1 organic hydroperoxide resistance protein [Paenarthrobacter sp. Z7-10]